MNDKTALDWLVYRCNEMDITEQLNWLGDASKPYQAQLELSALRARVQAVEALVAKWKKDAWNMVPEVYSSRDLHYKYFKLDNEAAGMMSCVDELEEVLKGGQA